MATLKISVAEVAAKRSLCSCGNYKCRKLYRYKPLSKRPSPYERFKQALASGAPMTLEQFDKRWPPELDKVVYVQEGYKE